MTFCTQNSIVENFFHLTIWSSSTWKLLFDPFILMLLQCTKYNPRNETEKGKKKEKKIL